MAPTSQRLAARLTTVKTTPAREHQPAAPTKKSRSGRQLKTPDDNWSPYWTAMAMKDEELEAQLKGLGVEVQREFRRNLDTYQRDHSAVIEWLGAIRSGSGLSEPADTAAVVKYHEDPRPQNPPTRTEQVEQHDQDVEMEEDLDEKDPPIKVEEYDPNWDPPIKYEETDEDDKKWMELPPFVGSTRQASSY